MGLTRALALDGTLPADPEPQGILIALRDEATVASGERLILLPAVVADKPFFKMPEGQADREYRRTDLRTSNGATVYVAVGKWLDLPQPWLNYLSTGQLL